MSKQSALMLAGQVTLAAAVAVAAVDGRPREALAIAAVFVAVGIVNVALIARRRRTH